MELTSVQPEYPRRRYWLQFTLLLCFLTCLIVGFGSLAALIMLRNQDLPVAESRVLPSVNSARIAPDLALHELVGDPAGALALQAINAGEIETARAILAFDSAIAPTTKATLYQLLSRRVLEVESSFTEQQEQVQEIQRQARALMLLSLKVDSSIRAQVLINGVSDLLAVDAGEDALTSATHLLRFAEQMPELLPVQRRQMLEPLSPFIRDLAAPEFQQQFTEFSRNPFVSEPGSQLGGFLHDLLAITTLDPAVESAQLVRNQSTISLINRIRSLPGQESPLRLEADTQSERESLAAALATEDQARRQWTQQIVNSDAPADQKLGVLFMLHQWTLLKVRMAIGGFGLSVAPMWEATLADLEQELIAINQNIDATIDQLSDTLEQPVDKATLRVEKFMWLALQSERGLYPFASSPLLSNDLRFAQNELASQGLDLALPVYWDTELTIPEFQLLAKNP